MSVLNAPALFFIISVYTLHERSTYSELSDILELHYIELDKIQVDNKQLEEMSNIERLGAYLKCSGNPEAKAYVEELIKTGDEVIEMTYTVLQKVSEEDKIRELRIAREKWEMWVAMEKTTGDENGKAAGLEEGIAKRNRKIATNLKNAGIDIDIIATITGLTEEEIRQL